MPCVVSRASKTSIWKNAAEKIVENSEVPFNSRGEAVNAEEGEDGGNKNGMRLKDDWVEAGKRLRAQIDREESNKKTEKEMNK